VKVIINSIAAYHVFLLDAPHAWTSGSEDWR